MTAVCTTTNLRIARETVELTINPNSKYLIFSDPDTVSRFATIYKDGLLDISYLIWEPRSFTELRYYGPSGQTKVRVINTKLVCEEHILTTIAEWLEHLKSHHFLNDFIFETEYALNLSFKHMFYLEKALTGTQMSDLILNKIQSISLEKWSFLLNFEPSIRIQNLYKQKILKSYDENLTFSENCLISGFKGSWKASTEFILDCHKKNIKLNFTFFQYDTTLNPSLRPLHFVLKENHMSNVKYLIQNYSIEEYFEFLTNHEMDQKDLFTLTIYRGLHAIIPRLSPENKLNRLYYPLLNEEVIDALAQSGFPIDTKEEGKTFLALIKDLHLLVCVIKKYPDLVSQNIHDLRTDSWICDNLTEEELIFLHEYVQTQPVLRWFKNWLPPNINFLKYFPDWKLITLEAFLPKIIITPPQIRENIIQTLKTIRPEFFQLTQDDFIHFNPYLNPHSQKIFTYLANSFNLFESPAFHDFLIEKEVEFVLHSFPPKLPPTEKIEGCLKLDFLQKAFKYTPPCNISVLEEAVPYLLFSDVNTVLEWINTHSCSAIRIQLHHEIRNYASKDLSLITRPNRLKDITDMLFFYASYNVKYIDNQTNFSNERNRVYSLLKFEYTLLECYQHLCKTREHHFSMFRTNINIPATTSRSFNSRYEYYNSIIDLYRGDSDHYVIEYTTESGQKFLLTKCTPTEWISPTHFTAIFQFLSELFEKLKKGHSVNLDRDIALFYWLASHCCPTRRGNAQYTLELRRFLLELNGMKATPPSRKWIDPNRIAISTPFEDFYNIYYQELFEKITVELPDTEETRATKSLKLGTHSEA